MNRKRGFLSLAGVVIVMISLIIIVMIGIGEDHLGSMRNIHLGLDLAGGVSVTYEAVEAGATKEQMDDTVYKIQKRVQDLNTESAVYKEGLNRIMLISREFQMQIRFCPD